MNYVVEALEPTTIDFTQIQDVRGQSGLTAETSVYWERQFANIMHLVVAKDVNRDALLGMGMIEVSPVTVSLSGLAVCRMSNFEDIPRIGISIADKMMDLLTIDRRPVVLEMEEPASEWARPWCQKAGFIRSYHRPNEIWIYSRKKSS